MGKTKTVILEEKKLQKEIDHYDTKEDVSVLSELSFLLTKMIIDETSTRFDEQKHMNAFDEIERGIIKSKIMKIVGKL